MEPVGSDGKLRKKLRKRKFPPAFRVCEQVAAFPPTLGEIRRTPKGLVQNVKSGGVYLAATSGGWLGLISAKATWMMPPASPSATPMRQAMV